MKFSKTIFIIFILSSVFSISLIASEKIELKLGVHPLHNPQKLMTAFDPICDYMNKNAQLFTCKVEPSKDYSHYNSRIKENYFDLLMPNPYQTVKSFDYNYEVVAKWGNDELFKGIFLVRKDSSIKSVSEIKGKVISFPAPTALAAALMPQLHLHKKGIKINVDYKPVYVGSQESSIIAVLNKKSDVGVTWYQPWNSFKIQNPAADNVLSVLEETIQLPNNSVMASKKLSNEIKNEFSKLLVEMKNSEEGKNILKVIGINEFEKANEKTYLPVKDFIKDYEKNMGTIPW